MMIVVTVISLFGLIVTATDSVAQQQASLSWKASLSYPVKFVCGPSTEKFQEGTVTGIHATAINVLNSSPEKTVRLKKWVTRALPFQRSGEISEVEEVQLKPGVAIEIECNELRMRLPASMTTQFRTGFLVIQSELPLTVVSVYSSRPTAGEVSTIDVEVIEAIRLEGDEPEAFADLVVEDIDMDNLRMDCQSGKYGCVTSVEVTIANRGNAAAGPFDTNTLFDPDQSVSVIEPNTEGLAAGASKTFSATTKPSRNCFDPNCEICATVDDGNAVAESDEANNKLCRVKDG